MSYKKAEGVREEEGGRGGEGGGGGGGGGGILIMIDVSELNFDYNVSEWNFASHFTSVNLVFPLLIIVTAIFHSHPCVCETCFT